MAAPTFDLVPEFVFTQEYRYASRKTEFDLGTVQAFAVQPQPKRVFRCVWQAADKADKDYLAAFVRDKKGSVDTFTFTLPDAHEPSANPGDGSVVAQVTGSYIERTYYYRITWFTANGETLVSPEASLLVPADNLFVLTVPPFPTNVTKAGIYVSTSSGTQTKQAEVTTSAGSWTEPDNSGPSNGLISGAAMPSSNTAIEDVTVRVEDDSFSWDKETAAQYSMAVNFIEDF